jgi:Flp pilus assembly protein TadD
VQRCRDYLIVTPGDVFAHRLLADLQLESGDATGARATLGRAIELDPAAPDAHFELGKLLERIEEPAVARASYERALDLAPEHGAARRRLVSMLLHSGIELEERDDTAGAREQYERVLEIEGDQPVAANNLAWILLADERSLDEALALARAAARGLPGDPGVRDTLGWIYALRGDTQRAIPLLESSAEGLPDEPAIRFHLGLAYLGADDRSAARDAIQMALDLGLSGADELQARKSLAEIARPESMAN